MHKTIHRRGPETSQNYAKKKTFSFKEKDDVAVLFYVVMMVVLIVFFKAKNFIFVDETGLNREYRRLYARAKRGVKIHETRPGKRQKRTNIVGALWGDKHIAPQNYEHATTAAFFEDWFEFELIPLLPEGAVIVMDNASFHRKNALWKIAEKYGVFVLFLPPYSLEFNPIEHSWANFKR